MKVRRRTTALIAIAALLFLSVCGLVAWRVERALNASRRTTAQMGLLTVEERTLGGAPR